MGARGAWLIGLAACMGLTVGCGPTTTTTASRTTTTVLITTSRTAATTTTAISTTQLTTTTTSEPTSTSCEPTTTEPTTTEPTSTSEPPTTTSPPTTAEPSTTLTPQEEATLALQERLTELGYWLGPIDGVFGPMTSHAVTAFQKVSGQPPTGLADDTTLAALAEATRPTPHADHDGFEVDLGRQVGLVVEDREVLWVVDVSTGTSATPTPRGRFAVYREINGDRVAPLGVLYRPKYFRGGFAIHGYGSVPSYPASHGCVRVIKPAMDMLWAGGYLDIGTPVTVHR